MQHLALICLLLYRFIHTAQTAVDCVEFLENSIATLKCGDLTEGKVTWSRDINGQKKELLTSHNGEVTKHVSDPHKRYSSGVYSVLIIFRVSLSDAGKYYCSGNRVELQVIPKSTTTSATTITTVTMTSAATRTKETKTRATPVTTCSNMATAETGGKQDKETTRERKQGITVNETRDHQPTGGSMTSTTVTRAKDTIVTVVSLSVGFGLLSLVLVSMLLWRCCVQTKSAEASNNDHVYESVEHLATSTTPVKKNQSDDLTSQTQSSEKLMEPMYYTIQAD